ncbi:MAG: AI-2E family transporter [Gemmatimonadetes bacterium]|nr:MAG: AI-2E family transporter [Gemmatimonadota bacterium]
MSSGTGKKADRIRKIQEKQTEQFSRYFLLALLIGVMVIFFNMVKIFLVPVLLAAVFCTLFFPLYTWLLERTKGNKAFSSLLCCLILLLGLLVPIYLVADSVSREAVVFYQSAEQEIREIIKKGDEGLLGKIKDNRWVQRFNLDKMDWQSTLKDVASTGGKLLATVINKTSKGTFQVVAILFITLFTMFYFFMDGEALIARVMYLSPLNDDYEREIIARFVSISRATIKGTLLIGLTQGGLGGITLWVLGVGSPILWGVVMVILSIIPMVGPAVVMIPAAIIQIVLGNIWQGVVILFVTLVIISNIDNLMRPRLVGQESGMHDLMIFFSTLGGISMFGAMGFIVGPVVAALFLAILDIYSKEFQIHLNMAQTFDAVSGEESPSLPPEPRPAEDDDVSSPTS